MRSVVWTATVLAIPFALLWAPPLAAQEAASEVEAETAAAGEPSDVFFETVDVNLINVDVIVTDKKGNIITGLTKDDFELFENKRPVQITNFYAVENGRPTAGAVEVQDEPVSGPEVAPKLIPSRDLVDPTIPEDQRLNLIVYIDNFNIRPFNRNRTFRNLRVFLREELTPGDRVMLVSYDRSLKVRRPFTSDPTLIASALTELETLTGHAVHYDSERRELLRAINEAESPVDVEWRVRQHAESGFNDLSFTIDALREFVDSLAGLIGRKAVLYVSDGVPLIPGHDLFFALQQKFGSTTMLTEASNWNASRRFLEVGAQANANRVTFYTIDAAGLRVGSASDVANEGVPLVGMSSFVDSTYISNLQTPLHILADETGGRAIINTNNVTPDLSEVAQELRNYYSLGFLPSHAGDGRMYNLEVKVKNRKGLRVRHRETYRDKSADARMSDGTMATLNFGFEENPLNITLETGDQQPHSSGHYLVTLVVKIPIGELVMVPHQANHVARLRLFFAAQDDEGGESEVQNVPLGIEVPSHKYETATSQYWAYEVQLLMRTGDQQVGIGVRDELGAVSSFLRHSVVVGRT